jgi:hypothetical protein
LEVGQRELSAAGSDIALFVEVYLLVTCDKNIRANIKFPAIEQHGLFNVLLHDPGCANRPFAVDIRQGVVCNGTPWLVWVSGLMKLFVAPPPHQEDAFGTDV